ncbi:hypothetical protein FQR65_LT08646 [Abscondita terminalis]|nr:hypothetical protein FQR65_LT08646 [Abscondita terminalis]
MNKWQDKVAIITGSSSGIGAAIAKALVNVGFKVVGLDILKEQKDYTEVLNSDTNNFFPLAVDVSKEEELLKAFEWIQDRFRSVHVLINNAAVKKPTTLVNGDSNMWRETIETNVIGLCILTREVVRNMQENEINGHIVHINSIGGHWVPPLAETNVYPATKHAVTALTETLRLELNGIGSKIKVTSISPSFVKTKMLEEAIKGNYEMLRNTPVLQPNDIADAVLYVLSTPPHVQVHEMIIHPI